MAKSKKYNKRRKGRKTRITRKHRHLGKKCPFCSMKGGGCTSCLKMSGGNFYKPAAPIPGPFVGQSWNPPVEDWPGVNGVGGDRNYLAYNTYPTDPQTSMRLYGGSRKRKNKRSKRGGVLPQNLVNVGREIGFNMGSAYNALNGYPAPVNPLPYKDQLSGSNNLRALIA